MKRPEYIIGDKIGELIYNTLCKIIKPDAEASTLTDITEDKLDELIRTFNLKGIILDIDETLRYDGKDIPEENEQWLDMVKSRLKVVVLSNGIDKNIAKFCEKKEIEYIKFALKPLKKGFRQACQILQLKPEEVMIIGDDIFDDIYGGKRSKVATLRITGSKVKSR